MKLSQLTKAKLQSWRNGADGFLQWIEDVKPCIPTKKGKYEPIQLEEWQKEHIRNALTLNDDGTFKFGTLLFSFPRRHSKTILCSLLMIWRICTREGENIFCLANSKTQSASVAFGTIKRICLNTPFLREFVGTQNIFNEKLTVESLNNIIRTVPFNPAVLFGEKLTVAWASEVHANISDEPLDAISSSLGDSQDSWLILDSTVDQEGGVLHKFEQLATSKQDLSICLCIRRYKDLADALKHLPHWLSKDRIKSQHAQLLPAIFAALHLNQRTQGDSCLFPKKLISNAKDKNLPKIIDNQALQTIVNGRNYLVGQGLDRAFGFSKHNDKTILTTVCKVASPNPAEEPIYYVLRQDDIFGSLGKLIKSAIRDAHTEYKLHNVTLETYNCQDIFNWTQAQGINSELIFANTAAQTPAFLELFRIFKEGRIFFSSELKELEKELLSFQYTYEKGKASFGSRNIKDDRVYSLVWAVYSLRDAELNSYSIDAIICDSKSVHAPLCFLRNDDCNSLILNCAQSCQTYHQVLQLYNQYCATNLSEDVSLQNFYKNLVVNSGMTAIL